MDKPDYRHEFSRGLFVENPLLRLALGICPSLAVSAAVENSFWMGLAVLFVLTCSNVLISALRKYIPTSVRMLCSMAIIAVFVTIVEQFMNAYQPEICQKLGIFVPLIAVNSIILNCVGTNAEHSSVASAAINGVGVSVGYMGALLLLATFREIVGAGTFFGWRVLPLGFPVIGVLVQPPGAFIVLGLLLGLVNLISDHYPKSDATLRR